VPRQRRPSQYQPWGPKLLQLQNLRGCFVLFFLGGQNRFGKVRKLKLQLSLFIITCLFHNNKAKQEHFVQFSDGE